MRVVLSTFGSRGDVEPLVGLAVRLREHGAEVVVCAPPDEDFAALLAGAGVAMVPVGPSARELTQAPPASVSIPERAAQIIGAQFEAVDAVTRDADLLVATGAMPAAAGALSVAERHGVRSVSVTFQQLTLPSARRGPLAYRGKPFPPEVTDTAALWELDARHADELFAAALNTHRAAAGMAPVVGVRDYVVGRRPWLATDPTLDPWTGAPGLAVVQTGSWLLPDTRPLAPELVEFLAAGAPPVYVGFGSMALHGSTDVAEVALTTARALGRRVVLARGWAELSAEGTDDDCFVVGEVNQQELFTRVAAVVHHGGQGTTTTATRAGAPQVVVPQLADQPYWAGRVAELGIGVAHAGAAPTVDSLTTALRTALSPDTARRAREVAGLIRTDGVAVAARLLLTA
ncbi:glycosyltransferase [Nocardia sp. AG03]|uniref:glycosyltransferase n=1 Tax=Nocardia sp. AG03 TaxID=3025312 RepID=UPI00241834E4|nr:glycosyltransferase [Nocardia sp. AG03]